MIYVHEPILEERMFSRVIADSEEELQEFGECLGLQPEWIQQKPRLHFMVYGTKLLLALTREKIQYLTVKEFENYFNNQI